MDALINRLQNADFGCKLVQRFFGCLLYANDIECNMSNGKNM